jgi:alkylation response protein AidB-like acyl-CoA dehydrogenase
MILDVTEEQSLIQSMARTFAQQVVAPEAAAIDEADLFPTRIYREMGELGLLGMTLPAEYGGSEADTLSWTLVQEELAKASAAVADAHMVCKLMCDVLLTNGSDQVRRAFLPRMARGEIICAIAQTEADTGSDVAAVQTLARRVDGGYRISGTKQFITFALNCDLAIVVATVDRTLGRGGIGLFLVSADTEGFSRGAKAPTMGVRGLATGELVFDDCFVPDDRVLAPPGAGLKRALTSLGSGRIGMAAQSVGIAQAAMDGAVAYARDRKAFGQSLTQFQAIQFMIADMSVNIEAARLMVRRAAVRKDQGASIIREASEAKLFASQMANRIVTDALQIHGAYGYTRDSQIERMFRDIRVYEIWEGTSQIQRLIIFRQLLETR